MQIVYTGEELPGSLTKSIFLAGPTPRSKDVISWRLEAVRILEKWGYDGVVFLPENRNGDRLADYDVQIDWEETMLNVADCIAFWVPREMQTMPALTTNIEWGEWMKSGKAVFGGPQDPQNQTRNKYLRLKAQEYFVPQFYTLEDTMYEAIKMVERGALRTGGERFVPLYIWRTEAFQSWYTELLVAGNRLDHARVEYVFRVGKNRDKVYLWILHANVHVAAENRNKSNEIVIGRPDISVVMMYYPALDMPNTSVVLIKEFRSTVRNVVGYVWELPGGSSTSAKPPDIIAAEEVEEETGLAINPDRLAAHGACQLASTVLSHKAHLFSVNLTDEEFVWLCEQKGKVHGLHPHIESGEQTYVEVKTVREIIEDNLVDWSMKGMILSALTRIQKGE